MIGTRPEDGSRRATDPPGARPAPSRPARPGWPLWAAGAAIFGALLAFALSDPGLGTPVFFVLLALASGAYLAAMALLAGGRHPTPRALAALGLLAFAWRIPLALAPTHPRADVSRYVWDARAVRAGVNPYAAPPADPALAHLRSPESWPLNNPDVPSPYPPGAQLFFLAATAPSESALAVKVALLLCEALLAVALWRWLGAIGAAPALVLAYLWNPLVAVEVARQGHVDAVGALLVVVAALALDRGRGALGAIALALAVAVKPLPLVLAPLLWRRISLRAAAAAGAVLAALYLPFSGPGAALGSVPEVVRRFRFNGPAFEALAAAAGPSLAAVAAVAAGLFAACWFRLRRGGASPAAWAWPQAAALLLAPLVYPWYLVWIAPFLVARATLPLLAWTVSIQVAYVAWYRPPGAPWEVPGWALLVEYGTLAAAAAWAAWGTARRAPRAARAGAA